VIGSCSPTPRRSPPARFRWRFSSRWLAGLVSFASPCVLPLVPGFLGYVTGAVRRGPGRAGTSRMHARALLFVAGFSSSSFVGRWPCRRPGRRSPAQSLLTRIGGVLVIVLALVFLGVGGRLGSQRELRTHWRPAAGLAGAPLLGAIFAVGWTPCTGPDPRRDLLPWRPRWPAMRRSPGEACWRGIQRGFGVCPSSWRPPAGRGRPGPTPGCAATSAACSWPAVLLLLVLGLLMVSGALGGHHVVGAVPPHHRIRDGPVSADDSTHSRPPRRSASPRSARSAGRAGRGATSPRCARRSSCCCCCRSRRCPARSSRSAPSTRAGSPTTSRQPDRRAVAGPAGLLRRLHLAVVLGRLPAAGRLAHRLHRAPQRSCTGTPCAPARPAPHARLERLAAHTSFPYAGPARPTRSPRPGGAAAPRYRVHAHDEVVGERRDRLSARDRQPRLPPGDVPGHRRGRGRAPVGLARRCHRPRGQTFTSTFRSYHTFSAGALVDPTITVPPFSMRIDRFDVRFEDQVGGAQFGAPRGFTAYTTTDGAPRARRSSRCSPSTSRSPSGEPMSSCSATAMRRSSPCATPPGRPLSAGHAVPRAGQLLHLGRGDQGALRPARRCSASRASSCRPPSRASPTGRCRSSPP
jgi:hypothetical protein